MPRTAKANAGVAPSPAVTGAIPRARGRGRRNGKPHADGQPASRPNELQMLLEALQAMRVGDFSIRMPHDQIGLMGKIADTFNEIVAANERMAMQLELVGEVVGR
ncbi:MAG TPA: hypothetical protein VMG55_04105, partial [Stellaceae bacterium]|nr:hypothetical protein [Stellaceae bacterium]